VKLSDFKGEKAIDVLADLLEPAAEIMTDSVIVSTIRSGEKIKAVKLALKGHKQAVIKILAITEGVDPKQYEPNVFSLPAKLLEILNDPELIGLFRLQSQTEENNSSGSVTENTEGEEK
jgi:hypothetical protein